MDERLVTQERILAKLARLWQTYPDLRLGQLMVNLTPPGKDLFYLDDEEMDDMITEFFLLGKVWHG